MARTHHANRFATELTTQMTPTTLNAAVTTTSGGPASPAYLVVDYDVPAKAEIILFDGTFDGTTFRTTTLANRYLTGSAAGSGITHNVGAKVISAPLGVALEDIWDELESGFTGAIQVQTFTASGNWSKPAGVKAVWVRVVGGGGGGGSGSGGGGGYAEKTFDASSLGSTVTVTVGSGGTGNGGTSSFGTVSATGGQQGGSGSGGAGGIGSGGDINVGGQGGGSAAGDESPGGSSVLGGGGFGSNNGGAGRPYGGGGGGTNSSTSGAAGVVIVHSYF